MSTAYNIVILELLVPHKPFLTEWPVLFVCWSLTSLCHSNGHIETMPAREINPFYCPDQDSIPVSQDTMIDEQSQRVDTTTP